MYVAYGPASVALFLDPLMPFKSFSLLDPLALVLPLDFTPRISPQIFTRSMNPQHLGYSSKILPPANFPRVTLAAFLPD